MTPHDRSPRVALVTGATRGAGRGIARQLGATGATVYVTGRTQLSGSAALPGSLADTVREIDAAGGRGIGVACDHSRDDDVRSLVDRIGAESGHLDVLVNNVFAVPDGLTAAKPFWEKSLDLLQMLDVGLRSTYVASSMCAPLMVGTPDRAPLVVNTSGFGGGCYVHGPLYGAVKAGVDKMAHDMAVDFRPWNVTAISLWMGLLRTERTAVTLAGDPDRYGKDGEVMESPDFIGRVIAAFDAQPDKLERSGSVLVASELGLELGVVDLDGTTPASRRPRLGGPPVYNDAVLY